jgi:hypothetical protein
MCILYAILKIFGFPFPLGNPTIVILGLFLGGIQLLSPLRAIFAFSFGTELAVLGLGELPPE